jgi:hypothetical protein
MRRTPKVAAKAGNKTTRTCDAGPGGIIRSDDPRMHDQDYQRSRQCHRQPVVERGSSASAMQSFGAPP